MGLLTFVPCSEVHGLQVFDYERLVWIDIERIASCHTDLIVFSSATLEWASSKYYPACIHRVQTPANTDRSSIVFKVRARPNATLKLSPSICKSLFDSPSVGDIQEMKVEDFLKQNLQTRFEDSSVIGFSLYSKFLLLF